MQMQPEVRVERAKPAVPPGAACTEGWTWPEDPGSASPLSPASRECRLLTLGLRLSEITVCDNWPQQL